ncbi:MAG: beta-lactamase family protein [Myxococcales bacterium]|nr:MAG: beta-lactamase family protein [Myxococcales bacterium]
MASSFQDRIKSEASRLLQAGVTGNAFPGAVASIGWREGDELVFAEASAGKLSSELGAVSTSAFYDLASLTKPFVAMAVLRLVEANKISLETRADRMLPDVRGGVGGEATLEQLLSHRAKLSSWGGLFLDVPHDVGSPAARRWILSEASRRRHEGPETVVYSDLGYLIGGEAVARHVGKSLDIVVKEEITDPIGISSDVFFPAALTPDKRAQIVSNSAPTEWCEWRGRMIRGEVHDENSAAFGGVAGHAGLFGTARGVARFGRAILESLAGRGDFLSKESIEGSLADRGDGNTYRFGWEMKSAQGSSAGKRMSAQSFGHLGFTGTSLWCDPNNDVVVALLSNRVHPSRANEKIKGFRPAFHDGMLAVLNKS